MAYADGVGRFSAGAPMRSGIAASTASVTSVNGILRTGIYLRTEWVRAVKQRLPLSADRERVRVNGRNRDVLLTVLRRMRPDHAVQGDKRRGRRAVRAIAVDVDPA